MSVQETYLTGIADAIREVDGSTSSIPAKTYADRIKQIGEDHKAELAKYDTIEISLSRNVDGRVEAICGDKLALLQLPEAEDVTINLEPSAYGSNALIVRSEGGWVGSNCTVSASCSPVPAPSIAIDAATGVVTAETCEAVGELQLETYGNAESVLTFTPSANDQRLETQGKYVMSDILVQGDANLVSGNIRAGVTIYGVDGTYDFTPTMTLNSETGTVFASIYEDGENVVKGSYQLETYGDAMAIPMLNPTAEDQYLETAGKFTLSDICIAGDANLVPENIAEGVSIFGVEGTHSGGSAPSLYICSVSSGNYSVSYGGATVTVTFSGISTINNIYAGNIDISYWAGNIFTSPVVSGTLSLGRLSKDGSIIANLQGTDISSGGVKVPGIPVAVVGNQVILDFSSKSSSGFTNVQLGPDTTGILYYLLYD